jgi:hypothetical protein
LPQVSAGVSENVNQTSVAELGIKNVPQIPSVIGPFSYSSADASVSATLFNFSSIQRFREARTAEDAVKLSYQDTLDAVTLVVGNSSSGNRSQLPDRGTGGSGAEHKGACTVTGTRVLLTSTSAATTSMMSANSRRSLTTTA